MTDQVSFQLNVDKPTGPDAPPPAADPNRPSWLPEKFKTPEDFVKSYGELETKLGSLTQQPETQQQKPQDQQQTTPPPKGDLSIPDAAAQSAVEQAGLDFEALGEEFQSNGNKLTDESYTKLEKAGFPRAIVDDYIGLKVGEAERLVTEVKQIAGGDEGYAAMVKWAVDNYKDAKAFNNMIKSGDASQMKIATQALHAAYVAANGSKPGLLSGQNGAVGADVYRDHSEFMKDIQDPRYRQSAAFRKDVEDKLRRSPI